MCAEGGGGAGEARASLEAQWQRACLSTQETREARVRSLIQARACVSVRMCVCARVLPWPGGPRVPKFTWSPGLCAQLHTGVCLYLGAFEDQGACKGDALEG